MRLFISCTSSSRQLMTITMTHSGTWYILQSFFALSTLTLGISACKVCEMLWTSFDPLLHPFHRMEFLVIPALALALLLNHEFTVLEVLWTFSIYLESVAILPQLFLVSKTGEAESITSHYLFALGSYRGLYLLNWVYRYYVEDHYELIAIVAGLVQTVLYCDFFYLYITKVLKGKKLQLPA